MDEKKKLTEEVKRYAKSLGVDMVGIAPVERFKNAPLRMSPKGLLPESKSVIVLGIHHLDCAVELGGYPTPHDIGPYGTQSSVMNPMLDDFAFKVARFLEDKGYKTLPIPVTNIWRYNPYKDLDVSFAPDLAHRYAAVAAGLGEIGWSGLFLSSEFGPRQRIISIITEVELIPDPMYEGEKLCDKCMECVKHCPTDAFRKEVKKINKIEIGNKIFEFPDTNKWRCAWAENFALNLSLPIPDKVDEKVILENLEKYGKRGGEEGCCLKYCMVKEKRYYQLNYTDAPRRKKEITKKADVIKEEILKMVQDEFVDVIAIATVEKFEDSHFFHPEFHLPDAQTVISIGIKIENETLEISSAVRRTIDFLSYKISHLLDVSGYSSITSGNVPHLTIGQKLTGKLKNYYFSTILTSAKISEFNWEKRTNKKKLKKEDIKNFCLEQKVDIVRFFTTSRYENFMKKIESYFSDIYYEIEDKGGIQSAFVPEIKEKKIEIKKVSDYLEEGKSVIAIGLHFPDACLDTAKITPAETVGPYAYAQYETIFLLRDIGLNVVKFLQNNGYKATLKESITGFYSFVKNSRGYLPDMRTGNIEAFLSGAGYIGENGVIITEKFGQRQRFIFIITDADFENDPLYNGENFCKKCSHPCITSCPTKAIKKGNTILKFEGREFKLPDLDIYRCDWAKRYGLSGKEGPSFYGIEPNVSIPTKITPEKIAECLINTKWGVQKLHINICEECIRNCSYKGEKNGK